MLEAFEQLDWCESADAAGGELDREWEPVESLADPANRPFIALVRLEPRLGLPRALMEERRGRLLGERFDWVDVLAGEVEHRSASDEQLQAWRAQKQVDVERRCGE